MSTPEIKLSNKQAISNFLIYNSHDKAKNTDKEYGFGVRGHTFVRIKNKDSWFAKRFFDLLIVLKFITLGKFGINTDQNAIDILRSKTLTKLDEAKNGQLTRSNGRTQLVFNLAVKEAPKNIQDLEAQIAKLQGELGLANGKLARSKTPEEYEKLTQERDSLRGQLQGVTKEREALDAKSQALQQQNEQLIEAAKAKAEASDAEEEVEAALAEGAQLLQSLNSQIEETAANAGAPTNPPTSSEATAVEANKDANAAGASPAPTAQKQPEADNTQPQAPEAAQNANAPEAPPAPPAPKQPVAGNTQPPAPEAAQNANAPEVPPAPKQPEAGNAPVAQPIEEVIKGFDDVTARVKAMDLNVNAPGSPDQPLGSTHSKFPETPGLDPLVQSATGSPALAPAAPAEAEHVSTNGIHKV